MVAFVAVKPLSKVTLALAKRLNDVAVDVPIVVTAVVLRNTFAEVLTVTSPASVMMLLVTVPMAPDPEFKVKTSVEIEPAVSRIVPVPTALMVTESSPVML